MDCNTGLDLSKYLDQISSNLKANKAAVLVGAGFSRNADGGTPSTPNFPTWLDLADLFYEKLYSGNAGNKRNLNPLALAEQVEAAYGRPSLDKLLISRIPDTQYRPSILHEKLLRLPWTDVFTTNYDTLLERASQQITEKRFNLVTCKEDLAGSADVPRIIKLHGSFPSHRPFIITTEDYRRYPKESAPFVNTMQQSLLENCLCLIGFSGDDPNFLQWIGWIHDNLGLENSPFIYLFTHNDFPDVQKKVLYQKKVIVLNVAPLAPKGSPKDCYLHLLDRLLGAVSTKKLAWPDPKWSNLTDKSLAEITECLRQVRISDPGWLILPYKRRQIARMILQEARFKLLSLSRNKQEGEIAFLFEYDWLRNRCLQPLFKDELREYKSVLDRNQSENPEENPYLAPILLSLLQSHRLDDNREEWEVIYDKIKGLTQITEEQRQRLSYELCLSAMFHFDFQQLRASLDGWKTDVQSFEWVLRKAGLLAECNDLQQSHALLQDALTILRHQLQYDDQNIRLLSLESTIMSLKRYIEHVIRWDKRNQSTTSETYDSEEERRLTHHKYEIDWYAEDDRFELLLTAPKKEWKETTTTPAFEFGRQTVTYHGGEDTETLTAYAFLLFREETGHPFRLHNITSGNKTAQGAAVRIAPYSFAWAVVAIVRSCDSAGADQILTRSALSIIDAQTADSLCKIYLDALLRAKGEITGNDWYFPKIFAQFAENVLPKLLSFLCCKCTVVMLDKMLKFMLDIYQDELRMNFRNVEILMPRLIEAFTEAEIIDRMPILLRFPLMPDDSRIQREFPDPLNFINIGEDLPRIDLSEVPETNGLFSKAQSQGNESLAALTRLIMLSINGFLSEEQNASLGRLIWEDGFHLPENFYRTICLSISHPATINAPEVIKEMVITDLKEQVRISSFALRNSEALLTEFEAASQKGLFAAKELSILLPICQALQKDISNHIERSAIPNENEMIQSQLYLLSRTAVNLLLYAPEWNPSDTEKEIMAQFLNGFQEQRVLHPALQILWARRCSMVLNVEKLLVDNLLLGSRYQVYGVFDMMLSEKEGIKELISSDTFQQLLTFITQQIFWRKQDNLISALNFMSILLKLAPATISSEIEQSLIFGLSCLLTESRISNEDTVEAAATKGETRKDAATLSWKLFQRFIAEDRPVPEILQQWRKVCCDPDEFVEIRKAGNC